MGCCAPDAGLTDPDAALRATRAAGFDNAVREVRPGVGFASYIAPAMHCGGCVASLERGLRAAPGVLSARANLTAKRVAVEFALERASGAQVADAIERLGFAVHPADDADAAAAAEARETADLVRRLGVAAFASMNVMLLSVAVWSGAEGATRDLMHWLSAVIALPVVIYSGRPFFVSALAGLRAGRLNMDAPISLAVILAAALSLWETALSGERAYFDAAVSLLFLLLVGRYLDRLMRARARSAAAGLMKLQPKGALTLTGSGPAWTPLADIRPGALVLCAPGERLAVDGVVTQGASDLDMSHLTGESAPEAISPGGVARAGALNLSGALTVRATAVGADTTLGEIAALMAEAESRKSRVARLADRAAMIYAPLAHIVAAAAFAGWLIAGADLRQAALVAIATLIITCPCALGLAAPMAQATAAGALFRRGVMLKDGAALERLALVDAAVFDKTGTLTTGRPQMRAPDVPAATLAAGVALAARSRHPLARALTAWADGAGIAGADARDVVEHPGLGLQGLVDGAPARLGSAAWVGATDARSPDDATAVWLRLGSDAPVALLFDAAPRPGARAALDALAARGVAVSIVSGDRPGPTAALAGRLGVTDWTAGATPQDKIARIRAMAGSGRRVLMVGDGINDAPALAAASVSAAPASAADVGRAAADMVFLGEDLGVLAQAHALARRTRAVILQNFAIAAAYNLIAAPVAIMGHATPLIAAVAMASSSLIVTANCLRLQRIGDAP